MQQFSCLHAIKRSWVPVVFAGFLEQVLLEHVAVERQRILLLVLLDEDEGVDDAVDDLLLDALAASVFVNF